MEKYEKICKLGSGNQGSVWLVENKNTNHYAAMKIYPAVSGKESAMRELGILRRFGGKGVPYLLDYQEDEEFVRIIMEYVEGSSLREMMKKQRVWSEKESLEIIYGIANILAVFHAQSPALIYGDLKPENIMIDREWNVYLIDFGSVIEEGERKRKVYGTKAYLPPDEEDIRPYRDTYALGVIMYEILTGMVLEQGIHTGKADVRHLSSGCRRLMQKAVKIRKESAYANAGQMCEDLKHIKENGREEKKMKKRSIRNGFVVDLKRVVMHGYKKGLCTLGITIVLSGLWCSARDIEAAEKREQQTIEVVADGIPRDEYGRKILIRNIDNWGTIKEK